METKVKTILSISGRPGLFELISQGKNMLIVESLIDKKRGPAYAKDKVVSLGDIAIYTQTKEMPLYEVLNLIKEKEQGKKIAQITKDANLLRKYFEEVLPDYDKEHVHPNDIRKLLSWYNILIEAGITDFPPAQENTEQEKENVAVSEENSEGTTAEDKETEEKTAE